MFNPFLIPIIVIALALLFAGFFTVKQQSAAIVERLGKFHSIKNAGFHWKIPLLDKIVGRVSLKIEQLDVEIETKTQDDVFVQMQVSVQFQILPNSVYQAFYELSQPAAQIRSYVFDTVLAEVPTMKLDAVFVNKTKIAEAVRINLSEEMEKYGFKIIKTLVTDVNPDQHVKDAMNKINEAERLKLAAQYKADAEKIQIVAKAEAEAESKKLQGIGIADQRKAIAQGLKESVEVLNDVNINSNEASSLIMVTQHYDTLDSMGKNSKSNLILLPSSPNSAGDLFQQLLTAQTAAAKLNNQKD